MSGDYTGDQRNVTQTLDIIKAHTTGEAQQLTGKFVLLVEGADWVFHMLSHLYTSIAYALAENKAILEESSNEFKQLALKIKAGNFNTTCKDQAKHVSFAIKKMANQSIIQSSNII